MKIKFGQHGKLTGVVPNRPGDGSHVFVYYIASRLNPRHTALSSKEYARSGAYDSSRWLSTGDGAFRYNVGPQDIAFAEAQDRRYLTEISVSDPELFLREMMPDGGGPGKGLDMAVEHHQNLAREFAPEVVRICLEKGVSHPGMMVDIDVLTKALESRLDLTALNLSNTGLNDKDLWRVLDALRANHALTNLDVTGNDLSAESLGLAAALVIFNHKKADLSALLMKYPITSSAGIDLLFDLLSVRSVNELMLGSIDLSGGYFERLLDFIASCQSIQSLDLSGIAFTEVMGRILLGTVNENHSLVALNVTETGLKNSVLIRLKLQLRRNAEGRSFFMKVGSGAGVAALPKAEPVETPEMYRCVHGGKIMLDPVIAADGEAYEREVIEQWLSNNSASPQTGELLPSKTLIPNKGLGRQISKFLAAHPELWNTNEIYVSQRLTDALIQAVHTQNSAGVEQAITTDKRLLTQELVDGKHLLLLALTSSPEVVQTVLESLGDRFWELPEIELNEGVSLFQSAAQHLGIPGAELIKTKLEWQPVDIQNQFEWAIGQADSKLARVCMALGADIEAVDPDGTRPLHRVIDLGKPEPIRLLLAVNADLQAQDADGNTALLRAVRAKRLDLIQLILSHNSSSAVLDAVNLAQENALHLAAQCGDTKQDHGIALFLLDAKIEGLARNAQGEKPEEVAFASGNSRMATLINRKILELIAAGQRREPVASTAEPKIKDIVIHNKGFEDTWRHRLGGSSFCSGVFRKTADESLWLGKSNILSTEDAAEADACKEKIASDIYEFFVINVAQTTLARLPIILPEWANDVTDLELDASRSHTVYLLSEIIAGFETFPGIPEFDDEARFYLTLPGRGKLEVLNLGRILAVASFIYDVDVIGGRGGNIGYQVIDNKIHCIKIDAGEAFNTRPELQVSPRAIRVATQAPEGILLFDKLPRSVQAEFLETVALISKTSDREMAKFFQRRGTESLLFYKEGRQLRAMPKIMKERKAELQAIYSAELAGVAPPPHLSTLRRGVVDEKDVLAAINRRKAETARLETRPKPQAAAVSYTIHFKDLHYEEEGYLGAGSFSRVYRGTWLGNEVAIKKLTAQGISRQAEEELRHEAAIMRELKHTNIMPLFGICVKPGHYSLVMKYMPKGSLYRVLHDEQEELTWPLRKEMSLGISRGVSYLHHAKPPILHRDLKSLNVMVDADYVPVITDFGLSKVRTETRTTMRQTQGGGIRDAKNAPPGTLAWMAPELFKRGKKTYTTACDIYSLGIILWELASRKTPWSEAEGADALIISWLAQGEREEIPAETPASYAQLIGKCWAQRAEDRPAIEEVVEALTQP